MVLQMQNALVEIKFNENYEPQVSAREVHERLGISQRFTDWFKYQTERLSLNEGYDFITILGESTGGRPSTDYILTLDTAKHICMASGGELAGRIRSYFIQVEQAWNKPEQVIARALQMSSKLLQSVQSEVEMLKPKAQMHDLFLAADNAQDMGTVAKAVGIGRNKLFQLLRERNILMSNNLPYQQYIDRGYFEVIERTIFIGQDLINKPQTFVTSKGVDYIGRIIGGKELTLAPT
jgi:anti-repressor protein